ncbi:RnfABCDGE type electron transport complex subunit G [Pseudomonas guariconensis]|uniref:RnfABCDGE type electron transport complex subunit G n=1 Tax=Pseudomonas TaxID=286 RepID=UPI0008A33700|nr:MULTISPECIES: RnfABCDGE type electron transport complex subunit G [Pseudomonas]MDD2090028.1 RnfABCDGE type electron transport complex subunit G [Pseudomonas guariconensis]OFS71524.1 electron transporter RnfG [Pseudomonas sp. HMSC08G10]
MNRTARGVLLVVAVGALSLGMALIWRHWTLSAIQQAEQQLQSRQWLSVLPDSSYDNQPLQAPLALRDTRLPHSQLLAGYRATLAGSPSAILLRSQVQGYAGPIVLAIAIAPNGRLLGIQVLEQQESPGLGARLIDPAVHWLEQFSGHAQTSRWALKRDQGDFDQLAGATVTSRAVIDALQDALRYFDTHRTALLEESAHE